MADKKKGKTPMVFKNCPFCGGRTYVRLAALELPFAYVNLCEDTSDCGAYGPEKATIREAVIASPTTWRSLYGDPPPDSPTPVVRNWR